MPTRLAVIAVLLATAAPASAAPVIHAHRGGPTLDGVHAYGEETLPAFRNAWLVERAVLELDAKLTADGVPVVFHDATLDRVTPCTGRVSEKTRRELDACPVDVLGSPGYELGGMPSPRPEPIPDLAAVLAFARDTGAPINLEIKSHPTEPDFDPASDAFAQRVMDAVVESRIPAAQVIVQSYWPPNLDVAKARLPGVAVSLLTQSGTTNDGGPAFAAARGIEWVSPQWPVSASFVEQAHGLGRKVVPYTLNRPEVVREAAAAGVDAVITDDPVMARRALGLAAPVPVAVGDVSAPRVSLRLPVLASDLGPSRRVRLRWKGRDEGGISAYTLDVRPLGSTAWRTVYAGSGTSTRLVAREGVTYSLRVRARDRAGNVSRYARDRLVVPYDAARLPLGRGWRSVRRRGAWGGSVAVARRGATAVLRLPGRRVWLVAPLLPRGGRLEVVAGGRRRVVSLRSSRFLPRARVFSVRVAGRRAVVRLRALGGGTVALDAVAYAPS